MQQRNLSNNEVLFICYEDIIKTNKPFLLQKLQEPEFKEKYSDMIDYSKIEGKTPDQLMALSLSFYYKNIFQNLAKTEFDYDAAEFTLSSQFDDLFSKSNPLAMGNNLKMLLSCSFLKKIYVYIERPDKRILTDLINEYDDDRISVIVGDFSKGVSKIPEKIDLFMLNDVNMINKLESIGLLKNACILIARLGYNSTFDQENNIVKLNYDDEKSKVYNCKVGIFSVI